MRDLARELSRRHSVRVLALRVDDGLHTRLSDGLAAPAPFVRFADGPVDVQPLRITSSRRALLAPLVLDVTPGIRRYAYGRMRLGSAGLFARVISPLIERHAREADIVQIWGGDLLAAAAVRAARRVGSPVVVFPSAHAGQWGDDPASAATYRAADRVLAQLDSDARVYRSLGVPAERIAVCGACTPEMQADTGRSVRERHGVEGPLVVFLGVRRPHKGWDLLLDAARVLAKSHPEITFAFVGPGPPLLADASTAHVLDVGAVDDDGRRAWLNAADVVCLPSRGESFGVAVIEAWSAGKPALVSDTPALAELVRRSGGGAIVSLDAGELAGALVELTSDTGRLRRLGAAGKAYWSTHYTVERVAACHERVYRELVGGRAL